MTVDNDQREANQTAGEGSVSLIRKVMAGGRGTCTTGREKSVRRASMGPSNNGDSEENGF